MNKLALASALVLSQALAMSALAQDKTTRAAVKAEAASAVKSGAIDKGEQVTVPKTASTKARADVKADAKAAVKAGAIDKGEQVSSPKVASTKDRAEVKKEAAAAVKSGETRKGEAASK